MSLSCIDNDRMKNIVLLEGKLMEFITNHSPMVSVELPDGTVYDCVHIIMVEIFANIRYPIGQNILDNTNVLLKYFNKDCLSTVDFLKNVDADGIILGLVGTNYDGHDLQYIWNGSGVVPWKISKANITDDVLHITQMTRAGLNKIIYEIKYDSLLLK